MGVGMVRRKVFGALCALLLVAAACGRSDDDAESATTAAPATTAAGAATTIAESTETTASGGSATTAAAAETTVAADPCEGVALEQTEVGVSADTITVLVMADVGSELAPGLFQGSIDGTKAWAEHVNANGGLACRQVKVLEWDSKISATEATNGFLEACAKALAMVGSNSLFVGDTTPVQNCPDMAGDATGIPDIAALSADSVHQCLPNVFSLTGTAGSCPYGGTGTRDFNIALGAIQQYQEIVEGPLHGIYLIPSDLPSTIAASMSQVRAMNSIGVVSDGEFGVSGRAEQAAYAEYVGAMRANDSNFAHNGSNDQAMIKLRTEAIAQGLADTGIIWSCSLSCYTPDFRSNPNVEGTYLSLSFLPYDEREPERRRWRPSSTRSTRTSPSRGRSGRGPPAGRSNRRSTRSSTQTVRTGSPGRRCWRR